MGRRRGSRLRPRPSRLDQSPRHIGQTAAPPRRNVAVLAQPSALPGGAAAPVLRPRAGAGADGAEGLAPRRQCPQGRRRPVPGIARPRHHPPQDGRRIVPAGRRQAQGRRRQAQGARGRPGPRRGGGEDVRRLRARILSAGARRCLRLGTVPHRPPSGAPGRGAAQTKRRTAARVPRFSPGFAEVPALFAGPNPPGVGEGPPRQRADLPRREPRRRAPAGRQGTRRAFAVSPRGRTDRRVQADRPRRAPPPRRRRRQGRRGFDRCLDPLRPPGGRRRPRPAQAPRE